MENSIKMDDLGVFPYFWKHPDVLMVGPPKIHLLNRSFDGRETLPRFFDGNKSRWNKHYRVLLDPCSFFVFFSSVIGWLFWNNRHLSLAKLLPLQASHLASKPSCVLWIGCYLTTDWGELAVSLILRFKKFKVVLWHHQLYTYIISVKKGDILLYSTLLFLAFFFLSVPPFLRRGNLRGKNSLLQKTWRQRPPIPMTRRSRIMMPRSF